MEFLQKWLQVMSKLLYKWSPLKYKLVKLLYIVCFWFGKCYLPCYIHLVYLQSPSLHFEMHHLMLVLIVTELFAVLCFPVMTTCYYLRFKVNYEQTGHTYFFSIYVDEEKGTYCNNPLYLFERWYFEFFYLVKLDTEMFYYLSQWIYQSYLSCRCFLLLFRKRCRMNL